jgi:hypothetical protein
VVQGQQQDERKQLAIAEDVMQADKEVLRKLAES